MTKKRVTNAELDIKLDYIKAKVDAVHKCVFGNGNPQRGMATRLLFVEQFQAGIKRVMWIAVGAAVVSAVGLLFALFGA